MGPQNAVVGDQNFGTDLPQMQVDPNQLTEERKAARFSKTAEFQKLKEHFEQRIAFYQTFLPDGRNISELTDPELGAAWKVANSIIGELRAVIAAYEQARETVDSV